MIVFVISLFLENEVKKVIDVGVVILSVSGNPLIPVSYTHLTLPTKA